MHTLRKILKLFFANHYGNTTIIGSRKNPNAAKQGLSAWEWKNTRLNRAINYKNF